MATILPFVVRPRATAPAPDRQGHSTIIIFPGIRYEKARESIERDGHETPATVDGGSRKGKRKAR
ncbi:hypothetical protein [Neoaquamicrobium sediminum]|uniref:Uncharacterized protein n=1 Tax=Neoaquamicrobium sediminum TaxID=1849104 RepID=A0ABV3WS08_9HYPH